MKALLISGSPRRRGNTMILLEHCRARLEAAGLETEVVSLASKNIAQCKACMKCKSNLDRACAQKDDDFSEVFGRMLEADVIVVGSPVHFGSAAPSLMALLDRAGYVSKANGNLFSRKLGGPVVVARRAGHNFTYAQLLLWYTINDMIVPGSVYWNVAFGREEGEVRADEEGLATVERFAENLAWLATTIMTAQV